MQYTARFARLVITIALCAASHSPAYAQIAAQKHDEKVPTELPAAIASQIAPGGVRATAGPASIDFWFVKGLPVKPGTLPPSWSDVEEGALVGAVRLAAAYPDIRGRTIKPGVYTLRYGIQPANGDHLGVSPFREFVLLSPAALDTEAAPRGHEGTIDISIRAVGGSHPAVWSIDPPSTTEAVLSKHSTELGHQSVVVEVPAARDGKPAGTLRFGIVLVGKIEA